MPAILYALAVIPAQTNVQVAPAPPPIVITPAPVMEMPAPKKGEASGPKPKNYPGIWANTNDYPAKALQEEREGTTAFRVDVAKDGKVTGCAVTESSGHADLDAVTCDNVSKRAQFYPAQDARGRAIAGSFTNRVRWQIPEMAIYASQPIITDSLPRPPKIMRPAELRVAKEDYPASALAAGEEGQVIFAVDVDADGKVRGCSVNKGSGSAALDQQSCKLASRWSFEPARDGNGNPTVGKAQHRLNWRLPKGTPRVGEAFGRALTNPFEKQGMMTLTLQFDEKGKLVDCAIENKGEFPLFGPRDAFTKEMCERGYSRDIKPFIDSSGKPVSKQVVVRMGVEHFEPKADSASATTATQ